MRLRLDQPGLYWFGCPVSNHAGRGMLGLIVVAGLAAGAIILIALIIIAPLAGVNYVSPDISAATCEPAS